MGIDAKRQTLIFGGEAAVIPRHALPPPPHVRRSVGPIFSPVPDEDAVDAGWDAAGPSPSAESSPQPSAEALESADLLIDEDRPHDRATVPNALAPVHEELSASELESDRSLATTRPPPAPRASLHELAMALQPLPVIATIEESAEPQPARTPTSVPPVSLDVRPPLTSMTAETAQSVPVPRVPPKYAALFVASHLAVAATVLAVVWARAPSPIVRHREPRLALEERTPISSAAGGSAADIAPLEGCRLQDLSRIIAPRAELGPGLDASVLESGFGVGLVSAASEATGIRLDASTLRTAETVRVQSLWPVARVAIDHDAEARLEVRIDANDSRTIAPSQRITAQKGGVFAIDAGGRMRLLWGIPGSVPKTTETLRAIARPDGASVVMVRRPGVIWAGITGQGPITPILRPRKTIGTPALAPSADGGILVWAERGSDGKSAFSIVGSMLDTDGKRTAASVPEVIAEGISPALATLPNGELLLTYADGGAGAHRVVAQRLGPDLSARGELLVLSSDANAGQPAVAVDAEGRAIIAYLAIQNGRAEVHATALVCR